MSEEQDWKVDQEEIDRLIAESENSSIQQVVLEELSESGGSGDRLEELERLHNLTLPVRVIFGSVKKTLEEVLHIEEGDIVRLDRFAGESVDVVVGDRVIAKGEITVVDGERFGVKLVEILPSGERIE